MSYNWAAAGIEVFSEPKRKRFGPNNSDLKTVGNAFIARIVDIDKFRAAFGDASLMRYANGTSLDVTCEAWGRNHPNAPEASWEQWMLANLRSERVVTQRVVTQVVEVEKLVEVRTLVIPAPDGSIVEFRATGEELDISDLAARLVDAGMKGPAALEFSKHLLKAK